MPHNLKPILSTVRKLEYRNEDSLQRLLFFNSQAQFAAINAVRTLCHQGRSTDQIHLEGYLERFSVNQNLLSEATSLSSCTQKAHFEQVKKELTDQIVRLLGKLENAISHKREFCLV